MIVYVNKFELVGEHSCIEAFTLISTWLSDKTGRRITPESLQKGEDIFFDSSSIKTYAASQATPISWAIAYSHPDLEIKNRTWITEIGIESKLDSGKQVTIISIFLEVRDENTRINIPVITTRPNLVSLINKSVYLSKQTIGLKAIRLSKNVDDFKILGYDISRKDRKYFIILISRRENDKFLIDPNILQEKVIGLAQVYYFDEDADLYELENEIEPSNMVYDGEVRFIYPNNTEHTRVFSGDYILSLIDELEEGVNPNTKIGTLNYSKTIYHELLSLLTEHSNILNKAFHISPKIIKARRKRADLAKYIAENKELSNFIEGLEKEKRELQEKYEKLELVDLLREDQLQELNKELEEKNNKLKSIHSRENRICVIEFGEEKEFYHDEIKFLLVNIIKNHFNNTDMEKNDRAYSILADIIKHNSHSEEGRKTFNELKKHFEDYRGLHKNSFKKKLNELGFDIIKKNNHPCLVFSGDERFQMFFSETPSDRRAGKNIARQIKKVFFHNFI